VVILHHFFEAIFAGLRMFRVVSAMHFTQSMSFTAIGLALIAYWRTSAISIVIGYGAACMVSIVGVLIWSLMRVERSADTADPISHREFWPPLVRFAIWVWITNLLTNVFAVTDRYMILHLGAFTPSEALVQVGNYHASNIVPLLLVSVANLMVGAMIPHLSHDWESGQQRAVGDRLNLGLKIASLTMLVAGLCVLTVCPLLFRYAFEDKYGGGLAVLPWALTASVWFGLLLVAQTFVWCAEKSHRAAGPLAVGLISNIILNILLLPVWGLRGAVIATALSTFITLMIQLLVNRKTGMQIQRSTLMMMLVPGFLAAGASVAEIATLAILLLAATRGLIFTNSERRKISVTVSRRLPWFSRRDRDDLS
jgi:PST family polysaccharide transporter